MKIITAQMIRDKLSFNGPMGLGELVKLLEADACERIGILVMLNHLKSKGEAELDVENGTWKSLVVLA